MFQVRGTVLRGTNENMPFTIIYSDHTLYSILACVPGTGSGGRETWKIKRSRPPRRLHLVFRARWEESSEDLLGGAFTCRPKHCFLGLCGSKVINKGGKFTTV